MNKMVLPLLLVCLFILPGWVSAEGLKIGFVDGVKLTQESPQATSAAARMSEEFEPRKNDLHEVNKQLRDREERFVKDSALMSTTEKQKMERDILAAKRELRLRETEFREDLTIRQNEEMAKVWSVLRTTIQDFAKEEGFDLILFEGVSYASEKADVTPKILKRLESK